MLVANVCQRMVKESRRTQLVPELYPNKADTVHPVRLLQPAVVVGRSFPRTFSTIGIVKEIRSTTTGMKRNISTGTTSIKWCGH